MDWSSRPPRECGIYRIVSPSGRFYIGSAANIRKRYNEHMGHLARGDHPNSKLQNAAKKHGVDSMRFEIVVLCERDVLRELEQLAINHLEPAYNIERTVGKVLFDFWIDPEWRARNAERCRQQSKERWNDPEYRAARQETMRQFNTPTRRQEASFRLAAKWQDPDFLAAGRERSRTTMRTLHADPEFKKAHSERMSRNQRERMKNPELRGKVGAAAKRSHSRPLYCITLNRYFSSLGEACSELGFSVAVIKKQLQGKSTRSGLVWRDLTDEEMITRGLNPEVVRRKIARPKPEYLKRGGTSQEARV